MNFSEFSKYPIQSCLLNLDFTWENNFLLADHVFTLENATLYHRKILKKYCKNDFLLADHIFTLENVALYHWHFLKLKKICQPLLCLISVIFLDQDVEENFVYGYTQKCLAVDWTIGQTAGGLTSWTKGRKHKFNILRLDFFCIKNPTSPLTRTWATGSEPTRPFYPTTKINPLFSVFRIFYFRSKLNRYFPFFGFFFLQIFDFRYIEIQIFIYISTILS